MTQVLTTLTDKTLIVESTFGELALSGVEGPVESGFANWLKFPITGAEESTAAL